ncbi:MAG: hypothetical protein HFE82_09555 [Erysipelotrichaceae bacterium]|nr:hypothetical protein [Erysipelotrichaceae bacterium]
MDYKIYKESLRDKVQEQLGEDVSVYYTEMVKNNNVKKEALALQTKGENTTPMIYVDSLLEAYACTGNMEESKNTVLEIYKGRNHVLADWNSFSWEQVKPYIRIRLVRMEGNEEYLKDKPYKKVLDLAMIFVVLLNEKEGEMAAQVSWTQMEAWGIDIEELYLTAIENFRKEEFIITNMTSLFPAELAEELEMGIDMYIFSTKKRIQGARAILRVDMLKTFADKKGCNLFILPSSVHEVLLICEEKYMCVAGLKAIVSSVNGDSDVIAAEEVLSDSVYYYDREKEEIRIAGENV